MAKRRPSGEGMIRLKKEGQWEGRIVVGHKKNEDPIHHYVLARTQKELIVKLPTASRYTAMPTSPRIRI